jgi:hypothetical protein
MAAAVTPRYVASYLDRPTTMIFMHEEKHITIKIMFNDYLEARSVRDFLEYPGNVGRDSSVERGIWYIKDQDDVRKTLSFMAGNCIIKGDFAKKLLKTI